MLNAGALSVSVCLSVCPSSWNASCVALYSISWREVLCGLMQNASQHGEAAPTQPVTSAAQQVTIAATAQPPSAAHIKKHNRLCRFISTDWGRDPNSVRQVDRKTDR